MGSWGSSNNLEYCPHSFSQRVWVASAYNPSLGAAATSLAVLMLPVSSTVLRIPTHAGFSAPLLVFSKVLSEHNSTYATRA